jgi:hypothetical protein
MRNFVTLIAFIVIGLPIAVPAAPLAHGDNETFFGAARALGFPQWDVS